MRPVTVTELLQPRPLSDIDQDIDLDLTLDLTLDITLDIDLDIDLDITLDIDLASQNETRGSHSLRRPTLQRLPCLLPLFRC